MIVARQTVVAERRQIVADRHQLGVDLLNSRQLSRTRGFLLRHCKSLCVGAARHGAATGTDGGLVTDRQCLSRSVITALEPTAAADHIRWSDSGLTSRPSFFCLYEGHT